MKKHDDNFAINSAYSNFITVPCRDGKCYQVGKYVSRLGMVLIQAESMYVIFSLVHEGRLFRRTVEVPFPSQRSISVLAGKFQREIVNHK